MRELNEMLGFYAKEDEGGKKRKFRYFNKGACSQAPDCEEILTIQNDRKAGELLPDFITFSKKKGQDNSNADISTSAKEDEKLTFEFDPSQISEEERGSMQKTKEFNDKIRKNPKDLKVWIDYLNFQDTITQSKFEKQRAERKLAIIEKALTSVAPAQKADLILLFMQTLTGLNGNADNFESNNSLWKQYLPQYPLCNRLILGYIHFLLSQKQLTVTKLRNCFVEITLMLLKAKTNAKNIQDRAKIDFILVNAIMEFCRIEKYVTLQSIYFLGRI